MKPPEVDVAVSVVDWVIDYPEAARVFEEFSIECCCAGKSLEHACRDANANLVAVCARLLPIVCAGGRNGCSANACRPISYWLAHSPPGWTSRVPAETADPLHVAAHVFELGQQFTRWLLLSAEQRWDTFTLQALSAALFSRYRVQADGHVQPVADCLALLELNWPPGSDAVQRCLAELQQTLLAPFAVFKAVRLPLETEHYPSREELQQAVEHLLVQRAVIATVVARLGATIRVLEPALHPPTSALLAAENEKERCHERHTNKSEPA